MTQHTTLQKFIDTLNTSNHEQLDFSPILHELQIWRDELKQNLQRNLLSADRFSPISPLSELLISFNQQIIADIHQWDDLWHELTPAQSLADTFDKNVMFLIFGKFNAGKSSLCNLLAELFKQQNQSVKSFYLSDGQIVYHQDTLSEGATETTAQLQGVCLGEKLILLDTPGLHSVTSKNSALTQRFIDSADGVLWLSSSSSPGQVQELEALARELRRHKPLLPVITRSDQIEEDELDGEICAVLCNKNVAQRAIQEADVHERSIEKLIEMHVDPKLLKNPVSISAQMVRQNNFDSSAMTEAGINQLFNALLDLIKPALSYKQRKSIEIFLHYLQEQILEPLTLIFDAALNQIQQKTQTMQLNLSQQKERIITQTWRNIVPQLPTLLVQHAQTQSIHRVLETVNVWTNETLHLQLQEHLTDYLLPEISLIKLELNPHIRYDIIANDKNEDLIIGHDQLYNELSTQLHNALTDHLTDVTSECSQQLTDLIAEQQQLNEMLLQFTESLNEIARKLRVNQSSDVLMPS
ncbi:hypothetical protein B9T31_11805 [Acinetobacter sp. ANC 4558]|uniref:dynamin family protein n=1 Tax=Acinetobacter sp. ANC 4558 TaxID=1977876 RepID=UPI000A34EAE7|nr:dynamin family protein [Acinetobacter sp. ANC 4558]OTG85474.1 hypothetical protein B9T31_11805 [Acinetobacter sp. ANC 4558]